jgi:glucan endo-1,3-alpha-glucosidase
MSAFKNRCVIILIARCDWQWNGGWPIHLTSHSPRKEIDSPALDTDQHQIQNLRGRTYMAAVSPWFFTVRSIRWDPPATAAHFLLHYQHYGPDSWNKNVR